MLIFFFQRMITLLQQKIQLWPKSMHLESNEYGYGLYLKLENACFSYIAAALQYCYALWLLESGKISSHDDYCCLDGKFFSQGSVSAFT